MKAALAALFAIALLGATPAPKPTPTPADLSNRIGQDAQMAAQLEVAFMRQHQAYDAFVQTVFASACDAHKGLRGVRLPSQSAAFPAVVFCTDGHVTRITGAALKESGP